MEASQRDVGRGMARIDPEDMKKIGARTGDIILLTGKRGTAARAMPAYPENRGKGLIEIDGIIRNNALIGIDDNIKIEMIEVEKAEEVVLSPLETSGQLLESGKYVVYAKRLLEGLPLVEGDRIRLNLLGTSLSFLVTRLKPKGTALMVCEATKITVLEKPVKKGKGVGVTYEDIGGLQEQIQRIREMIELPLRHPEVFYHLGIEPPKGVLLHGPPGTGKTLIAKAVANETFASFLSISGAEIHGKFYGESEARVREIFVQAQENIPCIIFIDEIDAIAPNRDEVTGEVEKRVVSQFLALMDGLKPRERVVVIGATNRPDALDPALRRGGRFDREIEIGVPDRDGRFEILQIHVRGMPLTDDVNLSKITELTYGFTGADISELCKEAAMKALRRVIPEIDFELNYVPLEVLNKLYVTMDDFIESLRLVEPSTLREVYVETPNVTWDDVGGLKEIKQELRESIEWPLTHNDLFDRAGVNPPKGILLSGSPGTGKTLLAKAVARESGINFINVKGPELMSKFVGESEKGVRKTFKRAKQVAPCIIFFDEFDALAPRRGSGITDSHVSERVISQLLTELDGLEELHGVIVLAATNRSDLIDPALLRPGRFDLILDVPTPDNEARAEIFMIHTRDNPLADDVSIEELVVGTEGYHGADIASICREAAMNAIRDFLSNMGEKDATQFKVGMEHFRKAIKKIKQKQEQAGN
jgi:transitional endoplasmic reticulum ATPase